MKLKKKNIVAQSSENVVLYANEGANSCTINVVANC